MELDSLRTDGKYLREEAYAEPSKLNARIALNRRFSIAAEQWRRWVFDRLDAPPGAQVLELGCGPGDLWVDNSDRLDTSWRLTLSDISPGMLEEARRRLGDCAAYAVADAQELPWADASFDVVVANHMLYHVAELDRALGEIVRILRPQGVLHASTVGRDHLAELRALVGQSAPWTRNHERFGLQTGTRRLRRWFDSVEVELYPSGLRVTETQPVIDYLASTTTALALRAEDIDRIGAEVSAAIAAHGAFAITHEVGLFTARTAARNPTSGSRD